MILERFPVDRMNLFLRPDSSIKALARLLAEPLPIQHLRQKRRRQKSLTPWIVWHQLIQVAGYMRPDIQPDDIQQTKRSTLWKSDKRTRQGIHFLDGVIILHRNLVCRRSVKCTDAIADEVGRVLANYHSFPQTHIAIMRHGVQ